MGNILIDVGHPAHVHLFRNAARKWQAQGHSVLFTALDREVILELLRRYDLPHVVTYKRRRGKLALLAELVLRTWQTYRAARRFAPDLFVSFGSPTAGLPAWLMRKPYLALTDTEFAPEQHLLFKPFATIIATPTVFQKNLGPKQVRYAGYHELAYLHPDEFTPDSAVLDSLGLGSESFFVVRFVSWGATHDVGEHGLTVAGKRALIEELSQHGRVLLSVEGDVAPDILPLVTPFPPDKIHDLLAFATMYVGEGGTMLTEAALLGTPAVFISSLRAGNWDDLGHNYKLLYMYTSGEDALRKVRELLNTPDLKELWQARRARLLEDRINPTPWLVDLGNRLLQDPHYFPAEPG